MKKSKNAPLNRKLKKINKKIESLGRTLATKRGAAALRRGLDFTRDNIDQKFSRLAVEIVKNSQDIRELKQFGPALSEIRENIWQIFNRIDAIERGSGKRSVTIEAGK